MKSTLEALKSAYNKINNVGWCQYTSRKTDTDGNITAYCISGAVVSSIPNSQEGNVQLELVANRLKILINEPNLCEDPKCNCAVANWNDKFERTKEEVLGLIQKAIDIEEAELLESCSLEEMKELTEASK
jgi:hypothetical protein